MKHWLALIGVLLLVVAPASAQPQPFTIEVIINTTGSNAFVGDFGVVSKPGGYPLK